MPRTIVSISDNNDIRQGWRVRVFVLPANAPGRTVVEQRFRREAAARRWAEEMAEEYGAEVRG
jgi:hypothetical protein